MSEKDQQRALTNTNKQPNSHRFWSLLSPSNDFAIGKENSALRIFGPRIRAMETAPTTHVTVPNIFAKPLIFRKFTFSYLKISGNQLHQNFGNFSYKERCINVILCIYPARNETTKVNAGIMLAMALPIDDEAK